ncbi:MAG: DNA polymerase I, partial [Oscillospiraceae bacterium]|nr:DNA polymerase I [Oscillospiraceae bacterium]
EADDILGTVSVICEKKGWECLVVTGDKDSLQLITDMTTVCNVKSRMGQTETIRYTPAVFREEYGFEPLLMVDLKALMGDSSDNIPGVPGIGEKTALELVRNYGTVDNIYANLPSLAIKEGVRKKLAAGEQSARLSYWLATILKVVPMVFEPEDNLWNGNYTDKLYALFKRLGFQKFIEKWGLEEKTDPAVPDASPALERINVDSPDGLEALLRAADAAGLLAVDFANDLDQVEICDGKAVYTAAWAGCGEGYNELLKAVFCAQKPKIGHNVKDLMNVLAREGYSRKGFVFDTALAGYLLDANESDYPLSRLSARYLGRECLGTEAVFALYPVLDRQLRELGMEKLYREIELPLCPVLSDMEQAGFFLDRKALFEFGESLNEDIAKLQASIWQHAGHEFNINSPKQLGEVLFEELMLPSGKKTKTGWSTNIDVMEKLRGKHPIVDEVLEYRTLTKLKSTYADGLLKVVGEDGRVRSSFQMTVTATGRLSSTEPNLQNIPVRKKLGAEIRKMFVAGPGMVLVDADYSQIELRLLAHISGDEAMRDAFLSGEDFHTITASKVFGVPVSEVTPTLRSRAKAVNFGIVYGISAFSLAQDIGVYPNEAKAYMDAYLEKYHGVRDYMERIKAKAKEDGYVSTLFGRRRYLPELKSANFNVRSFGERVALNMPVQGTAADIIKLAMVNVHRRLREAGMQARLILQVHDELIVECPTNEAEQVRQLLEQEMENAVQLSVPLTAEAHIGHSWAEAH